ncbi:meiotic recombination protein SPO11 [Anopheles bellator]|uniref:meiotic recombination protein SPO11 n=1 Tax=Anopheles bellator TaxID=139047 RepID=UPI002647E349|nr:meiotic recombination protein SPO11 [Anopheles bellator]
MKTDPSGDELTHQVALDEPCQTLTQETVGDVDFSGTISGVSEQHVQIRNKISNILQQIELHINQGTPLVTRRRLSWQNCSMESGMLQCTSLSQELQKGKRVAKHRLLLIVRMLATIYQLLTTGTSCTKREFYYLHLDLAQTSACCYAALADACALLEVDAWEVNVFNTAKGLVAGPLLLTLDSGQTIDCCSARWGTSVPLNVASITKLQCTAKVVLVVEKDTVFKRLLEDGIVETFANTVLLVTAKGYPDVSTRLLLRKIVESADIPVCGLMDADPHGMEIFCVYKFGSLAMAHRQQPLAIPTMRWIGLFASDIEVLGLQSVPLRDLELKKIDHMIKRPYAAGMLKHELLLLRQLAVKAEIESLLHITSDFITRVYIKKKLEECLVES